MKNIENRVWIRVRGKIESKLFDEVLDNIGSSERIQAWDRIRNRIKNMELNQVKENVEP